MTATTPDVDRTDPEAAIAAMVERVSNWGRWGAGDVRGTTNFLDDATRAHAATLVRRGTSISLSQRFENEGPQHGWHRRTNPIHTMFSTGTDAVQNVYGARHGFAGADDTITMPLQCSTQWDGLGHIFDHGKAWNGRDASIVTGAGDTVTGIETLAHVVAGRGVLLDVGRVHGEGGELPDGFAITPEHLDTTAAAHGVEIRRGDLVAVRTGQLTRVRRGIAAGKGWGGYAGGNAPGLSFFSAPWLHGREIAAIATDTWGFEVRPNEFENANQPLHQVVIPNIGLLVGEMWDLDTLAADCAEHGVYEYLLVAAPLPFTGAVGSPINPIALL